MIRWFCTPFVTPLGFLLFAVITGIALGQNWSFTAILIAFLFLGLAESFWSRYGK
jgi:hypothetical protein